MERDIAKLYRIFIRDRRGRAQAGGRTPRKRIASRHRRAPISAASAPSAGMAQRLFINIG
jgi:hypothetical protein